ncbi:MAG: aspartate 1-decarboxylase [Kiritimatiellae bacterium]|nr:aspartate 1-decarboxylase [Kiritimatiellia bacterium]
MQRIMVKSKIHRAVVTGADLHYEGSMAIDSALLEAADILPGEQIHVYNVNTGHRLITYAIPARRNSGTMMLNGAAARLGAVGDHVIVCSYVAMDDAEARTHKPRVVLVDPRNKARKP